MTESKEDKIRHLKKRLTLVTTSLANAINQINAGKVVSASMIDDLTTSQTHLQEEIRKLEAPDPEPPLTQPSPPEGRGNEEEEPDPEEGADPDPEKRRIIEKFSVRPRTYHLSQAAIDQRKKATKSPKKAEAMMGNTNAWKTGEHARSFVTRVFRPCLSSCPQYPCELIAEGETALGSICLDKKEFVKGLMAVQTALRTGEMTDLKELMALRIAGNIDILGMLQQDILENGVKCLSEKIDKDGNVIGHELKPNPSLLALPKMTEVTGATPESTMISAREIARNKVEKKKAKTMADIWSNLGFAEKESDVEVEEE
ncbi:MAG TPA: hypothetical protein DCS05_08785 [Nitrospiraceae bacterium]|nr:hypothetical protein [Nitrospiraceae bacterium]